MCEVCCFVAQPLQQLFGCCFNYCQPSRQSSNNNNTTISALKFEPSFEPAAFVVPRASFGHLWQHLPHLSACPTWLAARLVGVHLVNKLAIAFNVSLCASQAARLADDGFGPKTETETKTGPRVGLLRCCTLVVVAVVLYTYIFIFIFAFLWHPPAACLRSCSCANRKFTLMPKFHVIMT